MRNFTLGIILAGTVLFASSPACAGIAVITHPSAPESALTAEQVTQLFLGRAKSLPGGMVATPVDLAEGSPLRVQFVERVLGKTEQQVRSHWSRMVFTGKGHPPRSVASTAEVLRMVSSTPGYVGYVDARDVASAKVKVLYKLD